MCLVHYADFFSTGYATNILTDDVVVTTYYKTITRTVHQTTQVTEDITKTDRVRYTKTIIDEETATTTLATATVTTTVTAEPPPPLPRGLDVVVQPPNTPTYASVCGGVQAYKKACSCVGTTHGTVTASAPSVTVTVTQMSTVTEERISINTATVLTTVTIKKVQSTVTKSKAVTTIYETTTDATTTVDNTAVVTQTVQPFFMDFVYQAAGTPDKYGDLLSYGSPIEYIGGDVSESNAATFLYNPSDGSVTETSTDDYVYVDSGSLFASVRVGTAAELAGTGYIPINCVLTTATNYLECQSGVSSTFDAEWWFCYDTLYLVDSSVDDFPDDCPGATQVQVYVQNV